MGSGRCKMCFSGRLGLLVSCAVLGSGGRGEFRSGKRSHAIEIGYFDLRGLGSWSYQG